MPVLPVEGMQLFEKYQVCGVELVRQPSITDPSGETWHAKITVKLGTGETIGKMA